MENFLLQDNASARLWSQAFCIYAVLSLSTMAGMGIGSGLLALGTIYHLSRTWRAGGRSVLREVFLNPYGAASLALFLACLVSLLAAMAFPVEGSQEAVHLSSLKKFHYFLLPPLVAAALLHSGEKRRSLGSHPFWTVWAAMGALLGVVATLQFFGAELFPEPWLSSRFFRAVGTTGRFHGQGFMYFHLSFASAMSFVAAAGWARLFFPKAGDHGMRRLLWVATALLGSAGVFFSYSRIAFVALALLVLLLAFLKRPRWGIVATLAVLGIGAGLWTFSDSLHRRFSENVAGISERTVMWQAARDMFADHPITGVGFSRTGELSPYYKKKNVLGNTTDFTSHAHNNVLDMLGAVGSLGFAAWLFWWGFLIYAAGSAFRRASDGERWLPAAALAGFFAFHVNGLTQVNFWDGKSQHTLMIWAGVALALWIRRREISA